MSVYEGIMRGLNEAIEYNKAKRKEQSVNEIKATTYVERRETFFAQKLKRAEKALDNLVKYGTDPDACAERGEVVAFYQNAIAALQEQAEREKGCEWCNPNPYGHGEAIRPLISQVFNDKAQISTRISGDGLHTLAVPSPEDTNLAKRYSKCQIINYCPMCGRPLKEEHREV